MQISLLSLHKQVDPWGLTLPLPLPSRPRVSLLVLHPGATCFDGWMHQGAAGGGREPVSAKHSSLASTFTSLFPSMGGAASPGLDQLTSCSGLRAPAASPDPGWGDWKNRRPSSGPGQAGRENGWRGQRAQHQVSLSPRSFRLSLWLRCCSVLSLDSALNLCFPPGVGEPSPAV